MFFREKLISLGSSINLTALAGAAVIGALLVAGIDTASGGYRTTFRAPAYRAAHVFRPAPAFRSAPVLRPAAIYRPAVYRTPAFRPAPMSRPTIHAMPITRPTPDMARRQRPTIAINHIHDLARFSASREDSSYRGAPWPLAYAFSRLWHLPIPT